MREPLLLGIVPVNRRGNKRSAGANLPDRALTFCVCKLDVGRGRIQKVPAAVFARFSSKIRPTRNFGRPSRAPLPTDVIAGSAATRQVGAKSSPQNGNAMKTAQLLN